jgi:hypothetical protein
VSAEHVHRIQLVGVQAQRLHLEARTCNDPERLHAIGDELELLVESAMRIREEQITEALEHERQRAGRPWWRRLW